VEKRKNKEIKWKLQEEIRIKIRTKTWPAIRRQIGGWSSRSAWAT
jgi:hypothetical protein